MIRELSSPLRDFITEIALPTTGYFIFVLFCIGFTAFTFAVVTDIVSDPTDIVWQEDAQ
jgi:hypothetical protein